MRWPVRVYLLLVTLVTWSCGAGTEPDPLTGAHLTFLTPPGSAEGQVPFDPPLRVALEDANGIIITSADTDASIILVAQPTFPAGQPRTALQGTKLVRTVMGIATFDDVSLPLPGDGYRVQVNIGGLSVTSQSFSVRLTFTAQSAGDFHSCGLTIAGFVYCWGLNGLNQIGDSTNVSRYIPTPVKGRIAFRQVSAGGYHACGIELDGSVDCWGGLPTPTAIAGLTGIDQLSAGHVAQSSRTCAVTSTGGAHCWENYDSPVPVSGGVTFERISTGGAHACGLSADGVAYCWGANDRGQLGDSTLNEQNTPVAVAGGLRFREIAAGGEHTCGITSDSVAHCWGSNGVGALGDSTTDQRLVPTRVAGSVVFTQLSAGGAFTCGVTAAHAAYCWGNNGSGQLGDSSNTTRLAPTLVRGGHSFSEISAGVFHSCGLAADGVYCWGFSTGGGLLGVGDTSSGATLVPRRIVQ